MKLQHFIVPYVKDCVWRRGEPIIITVITCVSLLGLAGRVCSCVYIRVVCCGSSLPGDLPSAVSPAGFAAVSVCCGSSVPAIYQVRSRRQGLLLCPCVVALP